jgi:hypothetical protein
VVMLCVLAILDPYAIEAASAAANVGIILRVT